MEYSIFDVLDFINFESGNIDYDDLLETNPKFARDRELRYRIWASSTLIRIWWILWKITPSIRMIEWLFSRFLKDHVTIGNLTIFGCNAMMFAFQLRTNNGVWLFRPPCINLFKERFTWGMLYRSPNGTPGHKDAWIIYDDRY